MFEKKWYHNVCDKKKKQKPRDEGEIHKSLFRFLKKQVKLLKVR